MSNEIQAIPKTELPTIPAQTTYSQTGDKNTQIANANNVNINIILPGAPQANKSHLLNSGYSLSNEYYNLFVIGNESYEGNVGHFIVDAKRALTKSEGIAPEITAKFAHLDFEAIEQIKTFPTLFMSENHQYGRTDDEHEAYFGLVTDVKVQENGIKVHFQKISSVPQQKLNEIASNLAIKGSSSLNELNRTHWAIKRIDLLHELSAAGLKVFG